jgi:archaemetzincin
VELKTPRLPARLVVVPLGPVARDVLTEIASAAEAAYALRAELVPGRERPAYAFNKDRNQYHSSAVLRRLAAVRRPGERVPVLGVADVDLFVPDAPFVFGEADRDALTALFSIARLVRGPAGHPPEPERVRHRVGVEAVHELGHLLGLSSCSDFRCAMFLSRDVADTDRKGPLCGLCRAALGLG